MGTTGTKASTTTRARSLLLALLFLNFTCPTTRLLADTPPTFAFNIDLSAQPGGVNQPMALALDGNNNIYLADAANNRVLKLTGDGTYLAQFGKYGSGPGELSFPEGVAVDPGNNVYVADQNNQRIQKFSSTGAFLTQWGGLASPRSTTVSRGNNVYVGDDYNHRVVRFDTTGVFLGTWGTIGSGNGEFYYPLGVATDGSNNVYVADANNRIQKFSSNGTFLITWGGAGTGPGQFSLCCNGNDGPPQGVAVDPSNNLYVADRGNYRIQKFNSSGTYLTKWGTNGSSAGQFSNLLAVAVDSSGNLIYVLDGARIQVFTNNLGVSAPIIYSQPSDQTILAGSTATLRVGAFGGSPLNYQWQFHGTNLTDATGTALTLSNVMPVDGGPYAVVVSNNFGAVLSSNALLTVVPAVITNQPASLTVLGGSIAAFAVGVSAALPVSYQWTFYSTNLPAATNSTLTLSNVGPANVGIYVVQASNVAGTVSSTGAALTVLPAYAITLPANDISGSGAMLNSAVAPAVAETSAWFDWGTNTTYGNKVAATNLPAGRGLSFVSTALAGLSPGKIYHYRLVVSNEFGIASEADQQFALGGTVRMSSSAYVGSPPTGLLDVVAVSGGGNNAFALRNDGTVLVWGGNSFGQLNVPAGLSNVVAIAAGQYHMLALKADGKVVAWGAGTNNTGFPNLGQSIVPGGLSNVVAIAAGTDHSLALKRDGLIVAWGNNSYGQAASPVGLSNVVAIGAGDFHSIALRADGTVVVWGGNGQGQADIPAGLNNVVAISAGWYHNLALRSDGTVASWGNNSSGQAMVPDGLSNVVALAAGFLNSLAMKNDGAIIPWGSASVPPGVSNVVAISAGYDFSLALVSVPPTPLLDFESVTILGGNGNGLVDPNECNDATLAIRNRGTSPATNISATLSTSTPGVTILQRTSVYPDLFPHASATNTTNFRIRTSPSFVCGTPINLTLSLVYDGGTNSASFNPPEVGVGYTLAQSTGATIVQGTADTGNHSDDNVVTITLPFAYTFYGQNYSSATLDANGNIQFNTTNSVSAHTCLPVSFFSVGHFNDAIFAYWDDLRTDTAGSGIFTSVSGTAPNRIFNIEWRATYFNGGAALSFEVRLYESQQRVDLIYGNLNGNGSTATVGIQHGTNYTQFGCNSGTLSAGLQLSFQTAPCSDGGGACAVEPPAILSPSQSGTNFTFAFSTLSGLTYLVQYKDSLNDPVWQTLQSVAGDGTVKTITAPLSAAARRFFRLSAQ